MSSRSVPFWPIRFTPLKYKSIFLKVWLVTINNTLRLKNMFLFHDPYRISYTKQVVRKYLNVFMLLATTLLARSVSYTSNSSVILIYCSWRSTTNITVDPLVKAQNATIKLILLTLYFRLLITSSNIIFIFSSQ